MSRVWYRTEMHVHSWTLSVSMHIQPVKSNTEEGKKHPFTSILRTMWSYKNVTPKRSWFTWSSSSSALEPASSRKCFEFSLNRSEVLLHPMGYGNTLWQYFWSSWKSAVKYIHGVCQKKIGPSGRKQTHKRTFLLQPQHDRWTWSHFSGLPTWNLNIPLQIWKHLGLDFLQPENRLPDWITISSNRIKTFFFLPHKAKKLSSTEL